MSDEPWILSSDERCNLRANEGQQLPRLQHVLALDDPDTLLGAHDLPVRVTVLQERVESPELGRVSVLWQGAQAYLQDLPDAELHLLDTGHFALEDKLDEIAALMLDFLDRKVQAR